MANTKVSELSETNDLTGVQAVGVKTDAGISTACRFNIGTISDKIDTMVSGIVPAHINDFNVNEIYYAGQFCSYNNKYWRFTKTHYSGAWIDGEAVETDICKELSSVTSTDYESVSGIVEFFNADGTKNTGVSVGGKNVSVRFDNDTPLTYTTDSNGVFAFTVKKGVKYTVTAPNESGYATPVPQEITAALSTTIVDGKTYGGRILNVQYRPGVYANATVVVKITVSGKTAQEYAGKSATLQYVHGSASSLSPINSTVVWDGSEAKVTFTGVRQGETVRFYMPVVGSFVTPEETKFVVSGPSVSLTVNVEVNNQDGLYYLIAPPVGGGTSEYAWTEMSFENYKTTFGEDYSAVSANYPVTALHVATSGLVAVGGDYYVRINDLTSQRTVSACQWCTANVNHPNVTTTFGMNQRDANGKLMTGYMLSNSIAQGYTSPAAIWANNQTMNYKGDTLHGFIGTRTQWDVILSQQTRSDGTKVNYWEDIDTALKYFGYSGQTYRTGTHWWSACQSSAATAWYWGSGGGWFNGYKNNTYQCAVLFCGGLTLNLEL